jgi:sensor histidine kinase regulating citrate/malate metabolism
MNKIIDEYQGYIKTGNESLDLILTKESMACLKENIRFTAMLNGENFSFFQPHELYALFGNAIENAIHAVKKLPPEKRIIAVNETVAEGFTTVHFINYYDGNLKLDKDGLPVTEQEKNYHGFGVKSIRMLAEKYDGRLRLDVLDDVFQLNIFFPIQSDSLSRSFIPNNGKVA